MSLIVLLVMPIPSLYGCERVPRAAGRHRRGPRSSASRAGGDPRAGRDETGRVPVQRCQAPEGVRSFPLGRYDQERAVLRQGPRAVVEQQPVQGAVLVVEAAQGVGRLPGQVGGGEVSEGVRVAGRYGDLRDVVPLAEVVGEEPGRGGPFVKVRAVGGGHEAVDQGQREGLDEVGAAGGLRREDAAHRPAEEVDGPSQGRDLPRVPRRQFGQGRGEPAAGRGLQAVHRVRGGQRVDQGAVAEEVSAHRVDQDQYRPVAGSDRHEQGVDVPVEQRVLPRDGAGLEEAGQREPDAELLLDPPDQPHRRDRAAAAGEEVVVDRPDGRAAHLLPQPGQRRLPFGARCAAGRGGPVGVPAPAPAACSSARARRARASRLPLAVSGRAATVWKALGTAYEGRVVPSRARSAAGPGTGSPSVPGPPPSSATRKAIRRAAAPVPVTTQAAARTPAAPPAAARPPGGPPGSRAPWPGCRGGRGTPGCRRAGSGRGRRCGTAARRCGGGWGSGPRSVRAARSTPRPGRHRR